MQHLIRTPRILGPLLVLFVLGACRSTPESEPKPVAEAVEPATPAEPIQIVIWQDGTALIRGDVFRDMVLAGRAPSERSARIVANMETPFRYIQAVMEALKELGVEDVDVRLAGRDGSLAPE